MIEMTICMGSSCFTRGNNQNIEVIKEFAKKHNVELSLKISGELCRNQCSKGPMLIINGKEYPQISTAALPKLLEQVLLKKD